MITVATCTQAITNRISFSARDSYEFHDQNNYADNETHDLLGSCGIYTPSGGGVDLKMAVFVVVFLCTLVLPLLLLHGILFCVVNSCICMLIPWVTRTRSVGC